MIKDLDMKHENDSQEQQSEPLRFGEQIEKLKNELDEANAKANDNWDKALRAIAELENTKRRAEKDIQNAHKFALERFVQDLLPVVDSLEQALEVKTDEASLRQGVELTLKMLIDTLIKFGVIQINPLNEAFNPELHEAMAAQPNGEVAPNTVMVVFQKGYLLNGRLVRPARVVVSS
jgi:molecular chaperone GrpE